MLPNAQYVEWPISAKPKIYIRCVGNPPNRMKTIWLEQCLWRNCCVMSLCSVPQTYPGHKTGSKWLFFGYFCRRAHQNSLDWCEDKWFIKLQAEIDTNKLLLPCFTCYKWLIITSLMLALFWGFLPIWLHNVTFICECDVTHFVPAWIYFFFGSFFLTNYK